MPNYYNPYNYYPATYPMAPQNMGLGYNNPQFSTTPAGNSYAAPQMKTMEWVDGEIGAKAFQMPNGLPAGAVIPLWDNTEPYIYFKSWNQMGMPNPIQKIKYDPTPVQDEPSRMLPQGQSQAQNGNSGATETQPVIDTTMFATKNELEQMKEELKQAIQAQHQSSGMSAINMASDNQNGNRQNGNRGGNR